VDLHAPARLSERGYNVGVNEVRPDERLPRKLPLGAHTGRPPAHDPVAQLHAKTIAQVTDNLRTAVTLTLVLSTAGVVLRASTIRVYVAWGFVAVLSAALWSMRRRPKLATALALVLLQIILITSLIAFGPMAGTGALVAVGVFLAATHFSRPVSIGVATLATATFCVVGALAVSRGWGVPPLPLSTWVRTGVIGGGISVFIALATSSLLSGLRRALSELDEVRRINEETQAVLARRRELETAGRLIGGVAHDVNNTLTIMACCADELRREALSPSALELVKDIEATTQAASGTMRAMLDLVRPTRDETPHCDPANVIATVTRNLQRLLPDDVKLVTSLAHGQTVPLSRGAVLQTTMNLVLNSRDSLDGEHKQITLSVEPLEGAVVVAVRDTGRGMDPGTLARLGEPFFSTKGTAGTGLGLSMVRATVEACGGHVVFKSEMGRGTEVQLVLPAFVPSSEDAPPESTGDLAGSRVLLVEDDDTIRRAFARGLSALGASVTEAASVARALVAIADAGPAFDMLVSDGILGDGTVADLVTPFRDRCHGSPVLLCTAHSPDVFAGRGLTLEDMTMIGKPMSGAQLAQAAARTLRDSQKSVRCDTGRPT